ncbi:hypothetical protein [Bacteroides sedimenti]|uniref:Uncharacterized protein n=1 Tax=Bacteroides sedimenti TaxID=2136147 RepID=A0ABM8ID63_9BACE
MKSYKFCFYHILLLFVFQLNVFAQKSQTSGTYIGEEQEAIIIENNSFRIFPGILMDKDYSKTASGSIKYCTDNFLELNSTDYSKKVTESVVITESKISNMKDSILIVFHFPFSKQYKIEMHIEDLGKFESINNNKIIIKDNTKKIKSINFKIFNLDIIPEQTGNCYNIISYNYDSKYLIKNKESNCISISIPELTDAYFLNIFIKGEYALIKNGALWWRGKCYVK